MGRQSIFRFRENQRAKHASLPDQIGKLLEEASEVAQAEANGEGKWRILEETWDAIHAAEGILRKFDPTDAAISLALVKIKNRKRGDYGKEAK